MNTKKHWRILINIFKFTQIFFLVITLCSSCYGVEEKQEKLGKEITDFDARLEYARLLSNMQRYDDALTQLGNLLDSNPNSIPVKIEMAQVLYYQGKHKEALDNLEKIPSGELNDKTELLKADLYLALKDYPNAETIYKHALEKSPQDYLTKFKLAELLSWQKRYEESILLYQGILATHPEDIQIRRKYAMVLMWMGEDAKAAEELEKTLSQ